MVLASDATYPDALAGTPLAVAKHAPLLLTTPSGLDPAIATEITRVLSPGGTVYLLGGDAALSPAIDSQVQALGDVPQRIAGSDRAATAVAIAGVLGDPPTVLLATGLDFPDGLSAGAAAASQAGAVLLTDGSAQAAETGAYLAAHANDTVFAVGGPAAGADPAATPLAGSDRFATAVTVAMKFFSAPTAVGFASGLDFPDALAGGAGIGAAHGPLLLVPACGRRCRRRSAPTWARSAPRRRPAPCTGAPGWWATTCWPPSTRPSEEHAPSSPTDLGTRISDLGDRVCTGCRETGPRKARQRQHVRTRLPSARRRPPSRPGSAYAADRKAMMSGWARGSCIMKTWPPS